MGLKSFLLMLGAALHLTSPSCATGGGVPRAAATGEVYAVRFPADWTAQSDSRGTFVMTLPYVFEVRKEPSAPWGELLFALKSSSVSLERYAVRLGRESEVAPAPAGAWERAATVSSGNSYFGEHGTRLFPVTKEDGARPEFEFGGRTYRRTGEVWSKVMVSPGQTFLALLTYSSPDKATQGHVIFGGGEPRRGRFYWDIYAAAAGEKVASGSFDFADASPGILSATAQWVGEKYLLLPQDEAAQSCLLIPARDGLPD
ncbi:MAG TPA: hypothetical protein VF588_21280 [Pyrinomonadaceae bacterium]